LSVRLPGDDVSIVSPISPNAISPQKSVGKAAEEAEKGKIAKHRDGCRAAGYGFIPFVADIFGVLAPAANRTLRRIASRLCSELGYPTHKAVAVVYRRMSTAIQIAVGRQVLDSRAIVDMPDAIMEFPA
jgi:hypothetical protein